MVAQRRPIPLLGHQHVVGLTILVDRGTGLLRSWWPGRAGCALRRPLRRVPPPRYGFAGSRFSPAHPRMGDVTMSRNPDPRRRSNSAIRSACSAITRRCTTIDSSSRTRPSNRSATAFNDLEPDTLRSSRATASTLVATRHDYQPAEQLCDGVLNQHRSPALPTFQKASFRVGVR
jgi:hypothetical protein